MCWRGLKYKKITCGTEISQTSKLGDPQEKIRKLGLLDTLKLNYKEICLIDPVDCFSLYYFFVDCFPVDTGRKLNLHKTFRRRPGRLLNVLCTFNLHILCLLGFISLHFSLHFLNNYKQFRPPRTFQDVVFQQPKA